MINGPKKETVTFISHSHLKEEIEQFLKELTLPLELISQENWNIFIGFLNSVLINQPIVILPAYKNIKEIKLVKVNEYIAAVTVSFD